MTVFSGGKWKETGSNSNAEDLDTYYGSLSFSADLQYPGADTPFAQQGTARFELIPKEAVYYSEEGNINTAVNVNYEHNMIGAVSYTSRSVNLTGVTL